MDSKAPYRLCKSRPVYSSCSYATLCAVHRSSLLLLFPNGCPLVVVSTRNVCMPQICSTVADTQAASFFCAVRDASGDHRGGGGGGVLKHVPDRGPQNSNTAEAALLHGASYHIT